MMRFAGSTLLAANLLLIGWAAAGANENGAPPPPVRIGTSEKICQLTGDIDWETGQPTAARTFSNFGLDAVDLGYPVEHGAKLILLFGDSWPPPHGGGLAGEIPPDDAVGVTTRREPPPHVTNVISQDTFLVNPHHPICMIGHIGVGKSTAANAVFDLTEGFAKKSRRGKDSSSANTRGLLPTGGGGTTAFEFRVSYASEPSIRIDPQREDKILADIRELCAYWIAEATGEKRERAIPFEMERVYRNMAALPPRGRDTDPIHTLIRPETDVDGLMFEISNRLNLSARTRTELLYREDRAPDQSEADWLPKAMRCAKSW
jgi:hypothetical protein